MLAGERQMTRLSSTKGKSCWVLRHQSWSSYICIPDELLHGRCCRDNRQLRLHRVKRSGLDLGWGPANIAIQVTYQKGGR